MAFSKLLTRSDRLDKTADVSSGQRTIVRYVFGLRNLIVVKVTGTAFSGVPMDQFLRASRFRHPHVVQQTHAFEDTDSHHIQYNDRMRIKRYGSQSCSWSTGKGKCIPLFLCSRPRVCCARQVRPSSPAQSFHQARLNLVLTRGFLSLYPQL